MAETVNIELNVDEMTIDDLETFEEITETTLSAATRGELSAKALKAIIYIEQRRENPDYTLADAGKVKVGSLHLTSDEDEEEVEDDPSPDGGDDSTNAA